MSSPLVVCVVGTAVLLAGRTSAQLVFEPQVDAGSAGGAITPRLDLGDVDGDGDLDVVFSTDTDSVFHAYEVMLNDGTGALASASSVNVSLSIKALRLMRFDADAHVDLLTAASTGLFLRRGQGNGSFAPPELIHAAPGAAIGRIEIEDVTGDGLPDLVVLQGGVISLLPNLGDGDLAAPVAVGSVAPQGAYAARAADLDGNGVIDLLVAARDVTVPAQPKSVMHVFLGSTSGGFNDWGSYVVGDRADVQLVALEGDSVLDMVCASSAGVEVWLGLGTGGFQLATVLQAGAHDTGLAVGDYDDDGLPDLASVTVASREVVFWRQDAQGGLAVNLRLSHADPFGIHGQSPLATRPLIPADMDGDGRLDLVRTQVDDFTQVHVSVFRNHTYFPTEPFLDLGHALSDPGWAGLPVGGSDLPGMFLATPILLAEGTLQAGTPVHLRVLRHGVEPSTAWLVLGFNELMAPAWGGGTLVPSLDLLWGPFALPAFNSVADATTTMPAGVPSGMKFWMQAWFPPGDAFQDFSATSGVRATAP